jgi:Co/Zn/Cd efflux system component
LERLHSRHLGVLKIVLAINLVMFVVGIVSGIIARSTALSADSLDMLGDATVYAFSIYAIHKGDLWKIKAARLKGFIMALFGLGILVQASRTFADGTVPIFETMGIIGSLALCANLTCLILLWRHRSDDVNMRSTWACSRNDIIANLSVLGASLLVSITRSGVPDLIVGVSISVLFIASAIGVFRDAKAALEQRTIEMQTSAETAKV